MATVKNVFLSSVAKGLEPFRDAAHDAIRKLDGYQCVRMEDFGARAATPAEQCVAAIKSSDVFVGIIGQRYGSLVPDSSASFTELEYCTAVEMKLPRLTYIAPEDFPVPANLIESEEQREKLHQFRARVLAENTSEFFKSEDQLATQVVIALQNAREEAKKMPKVPVSPEEEASATGEETGGRTCLLFPVFTCWPGYDTGIMIANTGSDPFGT